MGMPFCKRYRADDGGVLGGRVAMRAGLGIADEDFGESPIRKPRDGREIAQAVAFQHKCFAGPAVLKTLSGAIAGSMHGGLLGWEAAPGLNEVVKADI
jgi:hypothetical protein